MKVAVNCDVFIVCLENTDLINTFGAIIKKAEHYYFTICKMSDYAPIL